MVNDGKVLGPWVGQLVLNCHVLRLDRAGPNDLNLIFSLRGYDSSACAPNRGQYCASLLRTRGFLIRTRVLMFMCDIIGQSMGDGSVENGET